MWELYDDSRTGRLPNINAIENLPILRAEVENALKNSKNRKVIGPDYIPVEVLKLLSDHKALDIQQQIVLI